VNCDLHFGLATGRNNEKVGLIYDSELIVFAVLAILKKALVKFCFALVVPIAAPFFSDGYVMEPELDRGLW
jgi:hypothetical protein